ncbi:MAG: hypothetical protein ACM3O7_12485 [Acidobacteriota bacterium]
MAAAVLVQLGLQSVHLWNVLAACQPVLLVTISPSRRISPIAVAWLGLGGGMMTDLVLNRIVGPGGIAGALAGLVVALTVRRLELEGPLFWIVGSLLAATVSEVSWLAIMATLGAAPDHGWYGALATIATTSASGLLVAATERGFRAWRSPERRRRRMLKSL